MKRSAIASAAVLVAAIGAVAATSAATLACDDERCSFSTAELVVEGSCPNGNVWESVATDGDWHEFSHRRTVRFVIKGRRAVSFHVFVAPEPRPHGKALPDGGVSNSSLFTTGAGNIATVVVFPLNPSVTETAFNVSNETCANYYVRVVADLESLAAGPTPARGQCAPPAATPGDGGSDGA